GRVGSVVLAKDKLGSYDALLVPGGCGGAKHLCDFAFKGADRQMNPAVKAFIQGFHQASKPVGLICIAPTTSAAIFGEGVRCTIGTDKDTAAAVEAMGAVHEAKQVHEVTVDKANKLVTTPAYMEATRIREAAEGINNLVKEVLRLAHAN